MRIFSALLLICLIASCRMSDSRRLLLDPDNLPTQNFKVAIDVDTVLVGQNGSVIYIPAGTFKSDKKIIDLELKEALSMKQMILGGLTTQNNGKALSSNGMIYLNSTSMNVTLARPLKVLIPSRSYNPKMKVFKGEENDGSINWVDPKPLPIDETLMKVQAGEALFKSNCANCHKIQDDFTGPALDGVTSRRSKTWLYNFTRNPALMIAKDQAARCLFEKWKPTVMTAFSGMSDTALDALYGYIEANSSNAHISDTVDVDCCVKCAEYLDAINSYAGNKVSDKEDDLVTLNRIIDVPAAALQDEPLTSDYERVSPSQVRATYYTIDITAFGWYNVDILLAEMRGCERSELTVSVLSNNNEVKIYLVIPAVKVFVEGGKLKNQVDYGFDAADGKVVLPEGKQCYVMAFSEQNEDLLFGMASFEAQSKQAITLKLEKIQRNDLEDVLSRLKLNDVSVRIQKQNRVKDMDEGQRKRTLDSIYKTRPRGCDCGDAPVRDTVLPIS